MTNIILNLLNDVRSDDVMMVLVFVILIPLGYLITANYYKQRGDIEGKSILMRNIVLWFLGLLLNIIPIIGPVFGLGLMVYTLYSGVKTALTQNERKLLRK
jgi:hypothetical protein